MHCVTWPVNVERRSTKSKRQHENWIDNWCWLVAVNQWSLHRAKWRDGVWLLPTKLTDHKLEFKVHRQTRRQAATTTAENSNKNSSRWSCPVVLDTVPYWRLFGDCWLALSTWQRQQPEKKPVAKKQLAVSWFPNIAQACVILVQCTRQLKGKRKQSANREK